MMTPLLWLLLLDGLLRLLLLWLRQWLLPLCLFFCPFYPVPF